MRREARFDIARQNPMLDANDVHGQRIVSDCLRDNAPRNVECIGYRLRRQRQNDLGM
jgi:hypothetical protein